MKQLTKKNYPDALYQHDKVIIKVEASWCGPCRMIKPILESVEETSTIPIFSVDIEEVPQVKANFSIGSVPTLLFLNKGQEVHRLQGVPSKAHIEHSIQALSNLK